MFNVFYTVHHLFFSFEAGIAEAQLPTLKDEI